MPEMIRQRYQLMDKLGQGGFGAVYRAVDVALDREVAVKLLNLANEKQDEMVARFKTEARVASSFEHQNILRVYDFGQDEDGRCFLVSELLKGVSLHEKLKPKKPLPISLALDVLYQVGSALEVAHSQNTIHRDIKPPNIFLNQPMRGPGFVKLLDFGIAKVVGTADQESLTVTGQIMGTPHYMSPEQIVNIKLVDYRSDIYSLGIVFYQMLMGVVPFDDESYFTIMKHQMQTPMPKLSLSDQPAELVAELDEILKIMTQKDVRKRVDQIGDILLKVQRIWQVYSGLIRSQTTGGFRALGMQETPYTELGGRSSAQLIGTESIDQMLAPFQDADRLLGPLLSSVHDNQASATTESAAEVSDQARESSQEDHAHDTPQTRMKEDSDLRHPRREVQNPLSSDPNHPDPKQRQTSSAEDQVVASSTVVTPPATVINPHPSRDLQSDLTIAQPPMPSKSWWPIALLCVAIIFVVIWFKIQPQDRSNGQLGPASLDAGTEDIQIDKLSPDKSVGALSLDQGTPKVDLSQVIDQGVNATPEVSGDVEESQLQVSDLDLGVSEDQAVPQDQAVSMDQDLPQDKAVSMDQSLPIQAEKASKSRLSSKPKKTPRSSKPKEKMSKTSPKNRPKSKPEFEGKLKFKPTQLSYEVDQKVTLVVPKYTGKGELRIETGGCAKVTSKSKLEIQFTKQMRCKIKVCYDTQCVSSVSFKVTQPLF